MPNTRRQQEAADGGVGGGPGLPQQFRPIGPQHRDDIAGRRDLVGGIRNTRMVRSQATTMKIRNRNGRTHAAFSAFDTPLCALQLRHVSLPD